jgi:hypothetical protein
MKVLVLDANVSYINPTRQYLPYLLKEVGSVVFYGPGYSSAEDLAAGISVFVQKNGPFDVAIHTEQALPQIIWQEAATRFGRDVFEFYFSGNLAGFTQQALESFWGEIAEVFKLVKLNVLSLLLWDYQGTTDQCLDYFCSGFDAILGLGSEQWDQDAIDRNPNALGYQATSNWSKLLSKHPEKIHSLIHFIAPQEFCFLNYSDRNIEWSVLGAGYTARKQAKFVLRGASVTVEDGRDLRHLIDAVRFKLGFPPKATGKKLARLNSTFMQTLHRSKASYTCGSSYHMPIRKFFEIPAAGAVLVCEPCYGLESLGFVSGENCIVAEPDELPCVVANLRKDPENAARIAGCGQELVLRKHSLHARARQVRECLRLLMEDKFQGSFWEHGELLYESTKHAASHTC